MVFTIAVYWSVKQGSEEEFLTFWKTKLQVKNKSVLVGEFLSKVDLPDGYNTWDLSAEGATTFVNVGIWKTREDFLKEIGSFMSNRQDFEKKFRVRAMLSPESWRLGDCELKSLTDKRTVP